MAYQIHHCFNCGKETKDYDELPNGRTIWVCSSKKCTKELRHIAQSMESEARERAHDDHYRAYYE